MKRREPRNKLPEWWYGRSKQLNTQRKMDRQFAIETSQRYYIFSGPVRNPRMKPLLHRGRKQWAR